MMPFLDDNKWLKSSQRLAAVFINFDMEDVLSHIHVTHKFSSNKYLNGVKLCWLLKKSFRDCYKLVYF